MAVMTDESSKNGVLRKDGGVPWYLPLRKATNPGPFFFSKLLVELIGRNY